MADRAAKQVRFTVKDRAQFDFEAIKAALKEKGYDAGAKVLTGPTES